MNFKKQESQFVKPDPFYTLTPFIPGGGAGEVDDSDYGAGGGGSGYVDTSQFTNSSMSSGVRYGDGYCTITFNGFN